MPAYRDTIDIWEYDKERMDPSTAGYAAYDIWVRPIANSGTYKGYMLADYTITPGKPSHTVIKTAGTQQALSILDDIGEQTITLPMTFEGTDEKTAQRNVSSWTKALINGGNPVRVKLPTGPEFVGRLTEVSDIENITWDGRMKLITYTLTGYLSGGLISSYHTSATAGTIKGTAPKVAAMLDFKKNPWTAACWVCGVHLTEVSEYYYIRFDGIKKQILGAKAPESGTALTWENIMQKAEGLNGFPYLESGKSYKLAELPAVGLTSNNGATTSLVSTCYSVYDEILL